ncbi:MAG: hypothetical protein ACR2OH_09210 [Microthrixaceae bacterium]
MRVSVTPRLSIAPRWRTAGVFAALTAGFVAGACSPEGGIELGQATSDDRLDPCALLTVEEINQVTGFDLATGQRPREYESNGQAVCNWEDHRSGLVHLQMHEGAADEQFDLVRSDLEEIGEATEVDVPGAQGAFEDASQGLVGMTVGDHFVQVAVWGLPSTESQHLELAEFVAGRL